MVDRNANGLCGAVAILLLAIAGFAPDIDDVTPQARQAVQARFPGAPVTEIETKLGGLYEIELMNGGRLWEMTVHEDGTVLEIETQVDVGVLPKPVAEAASQANGNLPLKEADRIELLARQTAAGIEPLAEPEVYYEVEWVDSGFKKEIAINPDGTLR